MPLHRIHTIILMTIQLLQLLLRSFNRFGNILSKIQMGSTKHLQLRNSFLEGELVTYKLFKSLLAILKFLKEQNLHCSLSIYLFPGLSVLFFFCLFLYVIVIQRQPSVTNTSVKTYRLCLP